MKVGVDLQGFRGLRFLLEPARQLRPEPQGVLAILDRPLRDDLPEGGSGRLEFLTPVGRERGAKEEGSKWAKRSKARRLMTACSPATPTGLEITTLSTRSRPSNSWSAPDVPARMSSPVMILGWVPRMERVSFSILAMESPPRLASIFCDDDIDLSKNALPVLSLREISGDPHLVQDLLKDDLALVSLSLERAGQLDTFDEDSAAA